jgi:predicted secreted protein
MLIFLIKLEKGSKTNFNKVQVDVIETDRNSLWKDWFSGEKKWQIEIDLLLPKFRESYIFLNDRLLESKKIASRFTSKGVSELLIYVENM